MTKGFAGRIALLLTVVALGLVIVIYPWGLSIDEAKQIASIANEVEVAGSFTLFEGLPHPMYEREALKRELEARETIRKGDEPFYVKPLIVTDQEINELRRIVTSRRSYKSQSETKKCGGFHADYCLSWKGKSAVYDFLVCFGCGEMEIQSPSSTTRYDLQNSAAKSLREILMKHRSQRPVAGQDP